MLRLTEITEDFKIGNFDFDDEKQSLIDNPIQISNWRQIGHQDALNTGFDGEISPRKPNECLLVDHGDFYG